MVITMKIFNEVFQRYDDLNASVQENVSAIRVVKAFVREDYEKSKFERRLPTCTGCLSRRMACCLSITRP